MKIVDAFKPKAFVFENVPGLLSACPGDVPVRYRIFEAFKAIGYDIRTPDKLKGSVYCAEDFDVPQKRNRVIIGLLTDLGVDKKTAAEDACNMEHGISEESLKALCDLRQFLRVIRQTSSLQQTDE